MASFAGSCWMWGGSYFPNGYGQVWSRPLKRATQAHRLVYEELVGPIPEGLQLDHMCRVLGCVNPEHLRLATPRQNIMAPGTTCLAALNQKKSECPSGHPYDSRNTYLYRGRRFCRTCRSAERLGRTNVARSARDDHRNSLRAK